MDDDANTSFEGIPNKGIANFKRSDKKKAIRKKRSNPKFIIHLLSCLDNGLHQHMLYYVNAKCEEFVVIYTDKKNKSIWKEKDVSLFKDSNEYLKEKLNRKHSRDKDEDWKARFRSNMSKTYGKYTEEIGTTKIGKCKRIVKYKILERPKPLVGEANTSNGNIENKSSRQRNKKNNTKINQQEDSQVNFIQSPNSFLQKDGVILKKKNESTIVYNDGLGNDETSKIISNDGLKKEEIKMEKEDKGNHYLCLSQNFYMRKNRNDKMNFMEVDGNDKSYCEDNTEISHHLPSFESQFSESQNASTISLLEKAMEKNEESTLSEAESQISKSSPAGSPIMHLTDVEDIGNLSNDLFCENNFKTDLCLLGYEILDNIGDSCDWQSSFTYFGGRSEEDLYYDEFSYVNFPYNQ